MGSGTGRKWKEIHTGLLRASLRDNLNTEPLKNKINYLLKISCSFMQNTHKKICLVLI